MAPRRAVTRQGDLLKLSGDTFTIKEELKRLGARYDGGQKCWFVAQDDSIAKKLEFLGFLAIPNPPEVISTSSNKSPLTTHELNEGSQEGVSERANESVWSVSQFSLFVENIFRQHLSFDFWIVGEISSLKTSSGHVYFDLLETEQERTLHTGRAASVSCCLWAGKIRLLADKLSECPLAEGMKVKLQVHCDFRREGSRLSLIIDDLDPSFTLGDLTIKRQQIVRELKRRGLYDRQRNTHRWSLFPVRIALLTAAGSRAHSDFMDELKISGLAFRVSLFDCHMQGERVQDDVTAAFQLIADAQEQEFDCVVITRGGGSRLDLRWFDDLEIGKAIAYCSLPVMTAIGHFDDVSVADEVALLAEKTPTGAARFLTNLVGQGFELILSQLERGARHAHLRVQRERQTLSRFDLRLEQVTQRRLERERDALEQATRALRLVRTTAAQPLRLGYSLLKNGQGRRLSADDFLTSDAPDQVQVQLWSRQKNAQVLLDMQVTGIHQSPLQGDGLEAIVAPGSPQPPSP